MLFYFRIIESLVLHNTVTVIGRMGKNVFYLFAVETDYVR